jgi:virulence factor
MFGAELARLDVQWQADGTILHASMNRRFGVTCERVMACYSNKTVEFNSFTEGSVWENNTEKRVALKDWTPMLTSKGFEAMILDWIDVVSKGKLEQAIIERNIATHQLAEALYEQIVSKV